MDTALVHNGIVAQVWRDTAAATLPEPAGGDELVEFAPGQVVCGMAWDGDELTVPTPVRTEAELRAYADAKHAAQMRGGVSIDGIWVSTTNGGKVDTVESVLLAQLMPAHVFDWVNGDVTIPLTGEQVVALSVQSGLWAQQNFTVLGQVRAGIAAETITTFEQIDAAGWPSNTVSTE